MQKWTKFIKNERKFLSISLIPRMSIIGNSYQEELSKSNKHRLSNKPERSPSYFWNNKISHCRNSFSTCFITSCTVLPTFCITPFTVWVWFSVMRNCKKDLWISWPLKKRWDLLDRSVLSHFNVNTLSWVRLQIKY